MADVRAAAHALMRACDAGDVPLVVTSREPALLLAMMPPAARGETYGAVFHAVSEWGEHFRVEVTGRG